jgi:hypothetical protein
MRRIGFCQLIRYNLGSIGRSVVDDDEFPIKASADWLAVVLRMDARKSAKELAQTYSSVNVRLSKYVMIGKLAFSL